MSLSRRDTIIIAVLVNAGLLAILFATALNTDDDSVVTDRGEIRQAMAEASYQPIQTPQNKSQVRDEVDQLLRQHRYPVAQSSLALSQATTPQTSQNTPHPAEVRYKEITVKRGDHLGKIAQTYGITVEALKRTNGLNNAQLQIGQILRIPVLPSQQATTQQQATALAEATPSTAVAAEYYVVQRGDNPWTIAKKNEVRVSDLLRLNNLDNEKARGLKVGQKLRIR